MANVEKLEQVMAHIKAHPDQHMQGSWGHKDECGTAYCFAGWAVTLAGYEMVWEDLGEHYPGWIARYCRNPEGTLYGVCHAAQELLGIETSESDILFEYSNTSDELEHMVKNLANGDSIDAGREVDW